MTVLNFAMWLLLAAAITLAFVSLAVLTLEMLEKGRTEIEGKDE